MIKILITGGAGNVGSELAIKLLNKGYYVVVADNLRTGKIENLKKAQQFDEYEFQMCDVNNYKQIEAIFDKHNFNYVFHYAALVGVKRTLDNPLFVLQDIDGIKNILELCKMNNVKRVFFSSSSEVYGESAEYPQNEISTPLNCNLPYAIVKKAGEAYLKSYNKEYGLDFGIFRFFNTYGINQSKDFVIKKFISQALNNEEITIYGDGSQTRTFCYVDDNIDATIKIMEDGLLFNKIINIGNNNEMSVLFLAKMIIDLVGSKSKIIHLPKLKEGDMVRRCPDIKLMKEVLDRDLIDIHTGVNKIIDYYKNSV